MNILGINCAGHDSSAALIKDGKLIFAAAEERFSRRKHDSGFPVNAIKAALRYAGLSCEELDAVAFGHEHAPAYGLQDIKALLGQKVALTLPNLIMPFLITAWQMAVGNGRRPMEAAFGPLGRTKAFDIHHHEAHAWSAYGLSGFDKSLVLVVDGRGGKESTSLYLAQGDKMKLLKSIDFPNSLGNFYYTFTEQLGFQGDSDEWKVMGLAAYGEPNKDISRAFKSSADGYWFDGRLYAPQMKIPFTLDRSRIGRLFGPASDPENLTKDDMDLAASVQEALEQAMFNLVREGIKLTGCSNLCLAGGVAMNSKANGKIAASGLVAEVFVQPAATDDGTAIGAAIAAHAAMGVGLPRYRLNDVYLGPEFSNEDVQKALATFKVPAVHLNNTEQVAASAIADGKIVGWFQGRMEFGPRALGNRSILADARRAEMKDLVNDSVKFRENWRPFAPSCLADEAGDYFQGCVEAPYMIVTYDVKPEMRSVIPAVTHVDNSARVQTVAESSNPRYHRLISEFRQQTGVPVVMNTSFNLKGEPIVCTPQDALKTFYSSGLDLLILGDYIIQKDPSWLSARLESLSQASGGAVAP